MDDQSTNDSKRTAEYDLVQRNRIGVVNNIIINDYHGISVVSDHVKIGFKHECYKKHGPRPPQHYETLNRKIRRSKAHLFELS